MKNSKRVLIIYTENEKLKKLYEENSKYHHKDDAGFDVYVPNNYFIMPAQTAKDRFEGDTKIHCSGPGVKIHLRIKCEAYDIIKNEKHPLSFNLYPRSSIGKTPLRLSNSIGLIDAGYRGELIALVDNISNEAYFVEEGKKLFQLVFADLKQANEIKVVTDENELSKTSRGEGGFGSTNISI